jgi:hypothetical protein
MISEAAGAGVIRQDVQQAIEREVRYRLGEGDAPEVLGGGGLIEAGTHVHRDAAVFSSGSGHGPQFSFDQGVPAARRQLGQLLGGDRLGCGLIGCHKRSLVWRQG